MTIGVGRGHSPSRTCRSEWQTPDASIRTRTSPAPRLGELERLDRDRLAERRGARPRAIAVTSRPPRRRSALPGGTVRDVGRPPHRRVDERLDVRGGDRSPASPASIASRATTIAIVRVTARRSPTGG